METLHKKISPDLGMCNYCKGTFKATKGNTTTLRRHLDLKHKENTDDPTINIETKRRKFAVESAKSKDLTNALALLLTVGLQQTSILNEQAFINYTFVAESRYEIPSVEKFSCENLPNLFHTEKGKLQDKVTADFEQGNIFTLLNLIRERITVYIAHFKLIQSAIISKRF